MSNQPHQRPLVPVGRSNQLERPKPLLLPQTREICAAAHAGNPVIGFVPGHGAPVFAAAIGASNPHWTTSAINNVFQSPRSDLNVSQKMPQSFLEHCNSMMSEYLIAI